MVDGSSYFPPELLWLEVMDRNLSGKNHVLNSTAEISTENAHEE